MAHDVFVSYPSDDKATADAVVAALEARGLRCWYAPRDVEPGADWAAAIIQAIGACQLTVLVFSQATNASTHILREVRQAADAQKPILPFRITPESPSESLQYYIGGTHWLDALTEPIEAHLGDLVEATQRILDGTPTDRATATPRPGLATPWSPQPTARPQRRRNLVFVAGGAVVLTIIAVVAVLNLGGRTAEVSSPESDLVDQEGTSNSATTDLVDQEGASNEAETAVAELADGWQPVSFITTDPGVWTVSGEQSLTAIEQDYADAFAWSTKTVDGDFALRFQLESPGIEATACVIAYGAAQPFHTQGSLIFCIAWDFFTLEKHTTYHSGENWVTAVPANNDFPGKLYEVEIEVAGNNASMSVDGAKVLSTVFDPEEIDDRGRIGLHKKQWTSPEITFSNIALRTGSDGSVERAEEVEDGFVCELDTGADPNHYPVSSRYITRSVEIDGAITWADEWADAACVDLRMHYGINLLNPNFLQARWWVQNDDEAIYFLARIPAEVGFDTAFVDYFWPEFVGTWEHNDAISISSDGTVSDSGQWNELQFYEDLDMTPPGTFDVVAAFTEDPDFVWVEMQHPLDSGDGYDWVFEPGRTYGNNPYDSVLVGMEVEEGNFLRYLQLTIGEP